MNIQILNMKNKNSFRGNWERGLPRFHPAFTVFGILNCSQIQHAVIFCEISII